MTPHVKRWITGIIAVPILFWIIAYGGELLFGWLILTATLMGMHEYNRMAFGAGCSVEKIETLMVALLMVVTSFSANLSMMLALLTFSVLTALILNLLRIKRHGLDLSRAGRVILGILYIPLLMAHFILIRGTHAGILWIFFILVMAFSGDIAAYYIGRTFGKRKLLPEISPSKTVEGMIGLVAGSMMGCLAYKFICFPMLSVTHTVVLGLIGSITGQLGDLSESAFKRAAGVKDSGAILPGHGGMLDRLDCLMFIAPWVYYYQKFVM